MIVSKVAILEQGETLGPGGFERDSEASSWKRESALNSQGLAIPMHCCSHSRSLQNLEYLSFSATSSMTTSRRLPVELNACTVLRTPSNNAERSHLIVNGDQKETIVLIPEALEAVFLATLRPPRVHSPSRRLDPSGFNCPHSSFTTHRHHHRTSTSLTALTTLFNQLTRHPRQRSRSIAHRVSRWQHTIDHGARSILPKPGHVHPLGLAREASNLLVHCRRLCRTCHGRNRTSNQTQTRRRTQTADSAHISK